MNILTFLLIIFHGAETVWDNRVITTLKYSRVRVKPTVVQGIPVGNVEVPYLVSLKLRSSKTDIKNYRWVNLCGGSIIAVNKVLSAAHCFEGDNYYFAKRFDLLGAAAGSIFTDLIHDGTPVTTPVGQWRTLSDVLLHRNFHFPLNDIALVLISPNWSFTDSVMPIPIARETVDYTTACYISGYGRLGYQLSSTKSDVLLRARIHLFTKLQCSVIWEMNMNTYICTDSTFGDASRGDSGGPLACHGTREAPLEPLLVGVVSGKNFDKTSLFTRVSEYSEWIDHAEMMRGHASGGCGTEVVGVAVPLVIIALLIYPVF